MDVERAFIRLAPYTFVVLLLITLGMGYLALFKSPEQGTQGSLSIRVENASVNDEFLKLETIVCNNTHDAQTWQGASSVFNQLDGPLVVPAVSRERVIEPGCVTSQIEYPMPDLAPGLWNYQAKAQIVGGGIIYATSNGFTIAP